MNDYFEIFEFTFKHTIGIIQDTFTFLIELTVVILGVAIPVILVLLIPLIVITIVADLFGLLFGGRRG